MNYSFIILILFSFPTEDKCDKYLSKLKRVEKYLVEGKRSKGIHLLYKIESSCQDPNLYSSIGDIYYYLKDYRKSQKFYFKSFKLSGLKQINEISLSQFLHSMYKVGEYELFNTVVSSKDFSDLIKYNKEIDALIKKNKFALKEKQDSIFFNPILLDFNTSNDEYFPSMPINSNLIIYTKRDINTELKDENFFIARKIQNNFTHPVKLGSNVNSEYREGSLSISLDGKDLFFASCNRPDTYGGCDLYYSKLINDSTWSKAINMAEPINSKYWESQPSISANGKILFFSSN